MRWGQEQVPARYRDGAGRALGAGSGMGLGVGPGWGQHRAGSGTGIGLGWGQDWDGTRISDPPPSVLLARPQQELTGVRAQCRGGERGPA